jgi:hypothetical protein
MTRPGGDPCGSRVASSSCSPSWPSPVRKAQCLARFRSRRREKRRTPARRPPKPLSSPVVRRRKATALALRKCANTRRRGRETCSQRASADAKDALGGPGGRPVRCVRQARTAPLAIVPTNFTTTIDNRSFRSFRARRSSTWGRPRRGRGGIRRHPQHEDDRRCTCVESTTRSPSTACSRRTRLFRPGPCGHLVLRRYDRARGRLGGLDRGLVDGRRDGAYPGIIARAVRGLYRQDSAGRGRGFASGSVEPRRDGDGVEQHRTRIA